LLNFAPVLAPGPIGQSGDRPRACLIHYRAPEIRHSEQAYCT